MGRGGDEVGLLNNQVGEGAVMQTLLINAKIVNCHSNQESMGSNGNTTFKLSFCFLAFITLERKNTFPAKKKEEKETKETRK